MLLQQYYNEMINRSIAPDIKEPVEFEIKLPAVQNFVLSNGVAVYALDMGQEPTLQINWVFYAGNWHEDKKTVAAATNFLLKNGTSTRTAFEINEHFEYFGAYLNRSCYTETSELTLHCMNKHIQELIPVVSELITDSIFPEEELKIYVQNAQQRLKVGLLKSDFVAGRLIDAQLFGKDHPYGRYSMPEDYNNLTCDDLRNFFEQHYKQGKLVIFVSGQIPSELPALLEKYFGSLPLKHHQTKGTEKIFSFEPATEKKSFILNDEQGVQAAIRIARPFPGRHHPDFQKANLLNNIFGGFFGSRLMANIREDKGYTYGIYSYIMNHMRDTAWIISTEAGRDVCQPTIEEIYKEMQIIREEPIDAEELQIARNYMMGSLLGDLDGPFQVMGRWRNLILNELEESYFYNGIQVIKTTPVEELQELAKKYLNPEDFYELVVV